jgi:hypothetical protein
MHLLDVASTPPMSAYVSGSGAPNLGFSLGRELRIDELESQFPILLREDFTAAPWCAILPRMSRGPL